MKQPNSGAQRSQTLDWFRGIGILAVIWGHADLPFLPGAFLFIDTFFVISGYLVSLSLLKACQPDGQGGAPVIMQPLRVFFANRVRRIVIPLAAAVLMTLGAGWFILLPDDLFALAQSSRATLFLYAHLYALTLGNYFDVVGDTAPLLHTWSLSLEEWFYAITPLLVLPALLWKRHVWVVILTLIACWSLYLAQNMSTDWDAMGASYSLFRTRVWQFMMGAIAALIWMRAPFLSVRVNDGLVLGGLVACFGSVLLLSDKLPSPGLVSLPAVFGVLAVLVLKPRSAILIRATSTAIVCFFGRRLYSLYLAHYPVIVYFDYLGFDFGWATGGVKFFLGTMFGLLFFKAFEAPLQGWRAIGFGKVCAIGSTLALLSVLFSGYVLRTGGAPERLPDAALVALAARFDVNPVRAECLQPKLTRFGYSCALGPQGGQVIALLGDSHSDAIAYQLARKLATRGIGVQHFWFAECPAIGATLADLGVFSGTCNKLSLEAHRIILSQANLAGVIYAVRWPWYLNDENDDNLRAYWRDAAGLPRGYGEMQDFTDDFVSVFAQSVASMRTRAVPVYVLSPVPSYPFDPVRQQALKFWGRFGTGERRADTTLALADYHTERANFDAAMAPLAVTVLEAQSAFCNESNCSPFLDDKSLYYDDNHVNDAGAAHLLQSILPDL